MPEITATPSQRRHATPIKANDRALSTSMMYHDIVEGTDHLRIPPGFQTARYIEHVVELTKDLLAQRPSQCESRKSPVQRFGKTFDDRLQRALWLTPAQLQEHFPKHRLHPYVALFVQCADKERLYDYRSMRNALSKAEYKEYAAARLRMLVALRAGALEPAFRKTVKAHQDKVRRNLNRTRDYVDAQLLRHSRLLVVRVDCMWTDGFAPAHDWLQARSHREALIEFLNKELPKLIQSKKDRAAKKKPDSNAGYVIGTEYGIETGWHFHVTLFLNGDAHENAVGIAALICSRWMKEITQGNGRYHNGNLAAKLGKYLDVGVGMVHRHDMAKRQILMDEVCRYAVKGCYFAEAQVGPKDRLLNKGKWPDEKDPKKGGRPESRMQQHPAMLTQVFSEKKKRFFQVWRPSEAPQLQVSY
ncbi:hypothetical protein ACSFA0_14710 [Variovorax sp. LT1P1]|uniref:hypothetical protein n=1 Tax=Variovorax sp. LT1P1 TaxID=3443730 RepID=UPI003F4605F4